MNSKVQNVAAAPVRKSAKCLKKWSGKEDSNLRPLPPESISPRRTRQFSVIFLERLPAYARLRSRSVPARGSILNLGELSYKTARWRTAILAPGLATER